MQSKTSTTYFLYILLALSYFFSYFFRISTSVVLPELQIEWGLSAAVVGFISSMYFYTYALLQPFCGILSDQYGPVRIIMIGITITAIGSFLFGLGTNVGMLIAGRLLMGIGLSPMLGGLLVYQSQSFAANRYAFLSGLSMTIGNFGSVVSVAPLSIAIASWGREYVFSSLSCLTLLIAVLLWILGRNTHSVRRSCEKSFSAVLRRRLYIACDIIHRSASLRVIILDWMIIFGGLMAFQGLWAVSWYHTCYPDAGKMASIAASMIGVGVMIGNFLGGNIGSIERQTVLKSVTVANFLIWMAMLLSFRLRFPLSMTMLFSFLLGIIDGILFVHFTATVNEVSPVGHGGAVFGVTNCCTFTAVIIFQWGTGVLLGKLQNEHTATQAYFFVFLVVTMFMVIPAIITKGIRDISRVEGSL